MHTLSVTPDPSRGAHDCSCRLLGRHAKRRDFRDLVSHGLGVAVSCNRGTRGKQMKIGTITRVREISPPRQFEVITGTSHLRQLEGGALREYKELALFTIDDATGSLNVASQYGNYAYQWTSIGSRTLASFLCSLDMQYFMEKAAQQPWRELDLDATIVELRRELFDRRRHNPDTVTKAIARAVWEDLEALSYETPQTNDQLFVHYQQLSNLYDFFPPYDMDLSSRTTATAQHFWDVIWKAFTDHLRTLEAGEVKRLKVAS